MDIFWEDNVRRKDGAALFMLLRGVALLATISGGIGMAIGFFMLMSQLSAANVAIIVGFGLLVAASRFFARWARIEYDYTLAGERLEIARVMGPNSRKTVLKASLSGGSGHPLPAGESAGQRFTLNRKSAKYQIEYTEDGERRRLTLEPSQEMVEQLKRISPQFKEMP